MDEGVVYLGEVLREALARWSGRHAPAEWVHGVVRAPRTYRHGAHNPQGGEASEQCDLNARNVWERERGTVI
jgi:hypothetical protein